MTTKGIGADISPVHFYPTLSRPPISLGPPARSILVLRTEYKVYIEVHLHQEHP